MYDVTIKPALNGYVVRVGCQRLVFTDIETVLTELRTYLQKPEETEENYKFNSLNSAIMGFTRDNKRAEVPHDLCIHSDSSED